jgi:TPR repeat protein
MAIRSFTRFCGLAIMLSSVGLGQGSSVPSRGIANTTLENDLSAAARGDPSAQLRVGKAYYFGTNDVNGHRNHAEAVKWFEAASAGGSKEAAAWLGNCYLWGDGVQEDRAHGAALVRSAADANDPVGLRFLATMYKVGVGVQRDYAQAFQLFSKAVALNDPDSYNRLANLYWNGLGTSKDVTKAVKLYAEGARLGDPWAQFRLAAIYYTGDPEAALPQDQVMSLQLYEKSAAQGIKEAAFYAGKMYAAGTGTKQDSQKSVEYYLRAARHKFAPALLSMGEAAEHGLGMPVNLLDAYAWYSLAADEGNPKAYERLVALAASFSPAQKGQAEARLRELKQSISE